MPAQVQFHGPLPVTLDAVPAVQRLVVGAEPSVELLDEPHKPFTGGLTGALQNAVEPPLLPAHSQFQGPEPPTIDAVPAEQRPVVGADPTMMLLALPHEPLIGGKEGAVHEAVDPP